MNERQTIIQIQAGTGCWETDKYPIGGKFRRPNNPLAIDRVKRHIEPPYRGCDIEVYVPRGDGTEYTIALNSKYLQEIESRDENPILDARERPQLA